jgi:hypothetical protein
MTGDRSLTPEQERVVVRATREMLMVAHRLLEEEPDTYARVLLARSRARSRRVL